jgi:hypothetical protein
MVWVVHPSKLQRLQEWKCGGDDSVIFLGAIKWKGNMTSSSTMIFMLCKNLSYMRLLCM